MSYTSALPLRYVVRHCDSAQAVLWNPEFSKHAAQHVYCATLVALGHWMFEWASLPKPWIYKSTPGGGAPRVLDATFWHT